MADLDKLVNELGQLTVLEAVDLSKADGEITCKACRRYIDE